MKKPVAKTSKKKPIAAAKATKGQKAKSPRTTKARRPAETRDAPAEMDAKFAAVARAFADERGVTAGRMMSSFGLKVGGKIFAMHSRDAFVVKLPKARVDELVSARKGVYFDPRRDGRLMKEWISIADRKAPWLELAREAYRFVKAGR